MRPFKLALVALVSGALLAVHAVAETSARPHLAGEVSVTILSSNLADGATVGEWGFSALAEVDDQCVLFDAGRYPDTVVRNIEALGVDLSCVTDVVLSHFHFDHTTGLEPLVAKYRADDEGAFARVHVASGFFLPRKIPSHSGDAEFNGMIGARKRLEAVGVTFLEHDAPTEILPGVWTTGPIERRHSEKTYPEIVEVEMGGEWIVDYVPDSQGLVVATAEGPIVLLGCGHSGSVNLLEQVRRTIQDEPIHALMGGMHLYAASDETLSWTAERLREIGLEHLMAGHCTGVEPLMRLRSGLGLDRTDRGCRRRRFTLRPR